MKTKTVVTHDLLTARDRKHNYDADCTCGVWSMTVPASHGEKAATMVRIAHGLHLERSQAGEK